MSNSYFLLIFIVLAVLLNTAGQIFLKLGSGENPLNLNLFVGLGLYAIGTVFYILVLGKMNLSITYPIVIGMTIILTTVSGMIFLSEEINFIQWVGIGLMISGISAISFGKIL